MQARGGIRRRIVIDDQGIAWSADSVELRRQLHCVTYCGRLIPDLVRNLGFIAVEQHEDWAAFDLRTTTASHGAAIGLLYWLAANGIERGCVRDQDKPVVELVPTLSTLLARMEKITGRAMTERVAERRLDRRHLSRQSPLRELLRRWTEAGSSFWFDDYEAIIREHLGNRFVLAQVKDDDRIVIVAVGNGLRIPNRSWFNTVIGSNLQDQPDRAYGRWVNDAYLQVHRSQQPAISDCDADIYWPGEGWVRRKYRRLIIPGTAPGGDRYLLSTNCTDAQVSLRPLAA